MALAFAGGAGGAEPLHSAGAARIPGGEWRSVLPTGTKEPSVRVEPFLLDRTPVTNAQFLAFIRRNERWRRGNAPAALADSGYLKQWRGPVDLGPVALPDQPVTGV